ncbi:MAG TPA: cupin domain-containing protein [Geminicoccaceae bacterium]|nr:cupin domain-containing protein [Geminicoccus sp.]HMU49390.1 cupin domain-containing protein [Geminicoccaceae bacterium]
MSGRFLLAREIEAEAVPFGAARWLSNPSATAASKLAVVDVTLDPDAGHAFHHHPRQEEVLYVVSGVVEQWLEKEKRLLGPGDGIFIPPGVVHASFNAGDGPARFIAILGPCVGDAGYEAVEVADRAPWNSLR